MLVTTRQVCGVCRRVTRHATYPLFETIECLKCWSVFNTVLESLIPCLEKTVEAQFVWADSTPISVGLNGLHLFDETEFVPYTGIPRTP